MSGRQGPTRAFRWAAGFVGVALLLVVYLVIAVEREGWSSSIVLPLLIVTAATVVGALAAIPLNEAIWRRILRWFNRDA